MTTATAPVHRDWARDGRDWPNRSASRFVRCGSIAWHVQQMGRGSVLLLLHGAGAATHSWRDLMPRLAQHFSVVAPDLPGHGFTRAPSGQHLTLKGMSDAVATLMRELGLAPEAIIGHSAGAAIAVQTVLSGQLGPRQLIGLNAALHPFRGLAGLVFPQMARTLALNPATPWVFAGLAGWSGQARRLIRSTGSQIEPRGEALYGRLLARPDHVSGALTMMAHWDLTPLQDGLSRLKIPLHLMTGDRDRAVPPQEASQLEARYPAVTVSRFPGVGHLMHEERPDLFSEEIRALAA